MNAKWRTALLATGAGALLASTQLQAATGRTEGTAVVTATGAGEYTIPIWTPPGTHGLQPSLSLTYSSRGGSGYFGYGWRLNGLSAITRCPNTWAQNGLTRDVRNDAADRFCLDGNQLRLVGSVAHGGDGAEYRTEIESFARIRSYGSAGNGPAYFRVEQKNGLIFEYGNTVDSQILSVGQSTARLWAVNKVSDRAGNAMLFTYVEDPVNGSFHIDRIQYTQNATAGANPHYEVKFYYDPIPAGEVDARYVSGSIVRRTLRASRIDVLHDSAVVRRYTLAYQPLSTTTRSRLASIQECSGPTIDCFPATTFTYQDTTAGVTAEGNAGLAVPVNPIDPLRLDVNGDGRDDVVYSSSTTAGSGHWMVAFANGSGYDAAIDTGIANNNYGGAVPFDYNADGLDDLLVPYSGGTWWVMLGGSSGLATPFDTAIAATATGTGANARGIDINGDGLQDLVWADLVGWAGGDAIRYRLREAAGTFSSTVYTLVGPYPADQIIMSAPFGPPGQRSPARVPDFNGDGGGDITYRTWAREYDDELRTYLYWYGVAALCPTSFSFAMTTSPSSSASHLYFGDFNGDGKSDLFHRTVSAYYLRLSTGKAFQSQTLGLAGYADEFLILDWDGDGFDDVLMQHTSSGTWHVMRSNGQTLTSATPTGINWSGADNAMVADVNGDGLADLAYSVGGSWKYRLHNGVTGDMLLTATDAFGNGAAFSYAPLSNYSLYTKYSTATYPTREFRGPMYVVSNLSLSDGIGGTYHLQNFTYEGARLDAQGRGLLGFAVRSWTDSRDHTVRRYASRQDFPYTGMVENARRVQSGGQIITEVQTTFSVHQYGSGHETRSLPYASQVTRSEREAGGTSNGQVILTAIQTNAVDAATGTLYDSTTTTTEATTANGAQASAAYVQRVHQPTAYFNNDWTHWCFGVPQQVELINSHGQYGGTSITRTSSLTWETDQCRVTQEIVEPGNALRVTRTFGYDNFGNLSSTSTLGNGMTARTSTSSWGTEGRFLSSVTNALSQTTQFTWNTSLGVLASVTDPNFIQTSWQQDAFGRRTRENRPDGTARTWTYEDCATSGCVDSNNKMLVTETVLDSGGATVTQRKLYLDRLERPIAASERMPSGSSNRVDRVYDAFGRVSRESAPCWWGACVPYWTIYGYDLLDRVTSLSRPVSAGDPSIQTSYNYYEGLTTRTVDALGKQSTRITNVLGALVRSMDHDGYYQNFDYDPFGNLLRVTDSLSLTLLTNTYNGRGMLIGQTDIVAGTLAYTPNALGEIVQHRNARNQLTTFTYDALGRMTSRDEAEGVSTYTFGTSASAHDIGRLASLSGPGYLEGYSYDAAGRLLQRTITSDATYQVDYTYNAAGLLDTLTYPMSTSGYRLALQYEYRNGSLWKVRSSNPATVFWTANDTDARGNLISETLGNGIQTLRGFDAVSGWLDFVQSGSGGAVQDLGYAWDRVGNLTSRQDVRQGLLESFTYDNLHRLTGASGPDPMTVTYDARGNITGRTGGVGAGLGHTITWYSYELPDTITAATGGSSSQFFYAPDRSRWKQVASYGAASEQTVYIGNGLVEKVTLGGVTSWKHYIAGGSGAVAVYTHKSDGTQELHYLTQDHLGSIDSITDAGGGIEVRLSFGSFGRRRREAGWYGNPTSADWNEITGSTRRGYTGHEMLDNLNLTHMNGRVYDQTIGRFLSADPLVQDQAVTGSFNRYSYVFNNPLKLVDPGGFAGTDFSYQLQNGFFTEFGSPPHYGSAGSFGSDVAWGMADGPARGTAVRTRTGPSPVVPSALGSADGSTEHGVFFEPMYEPLRLTDGPDFATVAGLVAGVGNTVGDGLAFNNRIWGYWKGKNGKWYADRWGGNGATGGRSAAFSQAAGWKFLGTAGAVSSVVISSSTIAGALANDRPNDIPKPALDIGVTGWSVLTGPPGWVAGTSYFLIDVTVGWRPALESLNLNMEQNRAILGPTWVPWARE